MRLLQKPNSVIFCEATPCFGSPVPHGRKLPVTLLSNGQDYSYAYIHGTAPVAEWFRVLHARTP